MLRFLRSNKRVEQDDASLLARFQKTGKPEDLTPLFERYLSLVYGQCLNYLGNATKAEDAVMEIFQHLLKKVPNQEISNFRNWLQTVVRNFCLMQLRKEKRDPIQNSGDLIMQSERFEHLVNDTSESVDKTVALRKCMATLPKEQRICIQRFYLEKGNTYKSIASQLQLEVGRVRSFIQNGRRNLKICLEQKQSSI